MKIELTLPEDAREALLSAHKWEGQVSMAYSPDGSKNLIRLKAIQDEVDSLPDLTEDERSVVNAWNTSTYILGRARAESRNNVTTPDEIDIHVNIIRAAMNIVGCARLLASMKSYFSACENGDHIWKAERDTRPRNHGYKNLIGFLRKLTELRKKGSGRPWWDKINRQPVEKIEDDHPGLTMKLADKFAKIMLGRRTSGLKNPSKDYVNFKKAVGLALRVEKANSYGLDFDDVIEEVISCVKEHWAPEPIFSGHLCSMFTWQTLFPQYLKNIYS